MKRIKTNMKRIKTNMKRIKMNMKKRRMKNRIILNMIQIILITQTIMNMKIIKFLIMNKIMAQMNSKIQKKKNTQKIMNKIMKMSKMKMVNKM